MKRLLNTIRTLWYIVKYQYLLRKATFGSHLQIQCKLSIKGPGKVSIGSGCLFETNLWGDDYVTLYTHQKDAQIILGNNVVLRGARFGCHASILVEDNAVLECASIFDSNFHNLDATKRDEDFHHSDRPVVIGEGSYVGCECLCGKGTILGKHVVLLPCTAIGTKRVPDNRYVCGNPAKMIKKL